MVVFPELFPILQHQPKNMRIYFILSAFMLFGMGVFGQNNAVDTANFPYWISMMDNPQANFHATVSAFEKYWEHRTRQKGDGYNAFKRWEYYWESRLNSDGTRRNAAQTYEAMMPYSEWAALEYSRGKWNNLGPINVIRFRNGNVRGIGRVNSLAFHPTDSLIMYAGAPKGGFWRTFDGGKSWSTTTDLLPTLGVSSIAVHPQMPSLILLGTGDRDAGDSQGMGVFKSTDGGATFTASNAGMAVQTVNKLFFVPQSPGKVIAATSNGIYLSRDSGSTWTRSSSFTQPAKDLVMKPNNLAVWYTTVNGSFYRSVDTGNTWALVRSGLPGTSIQRGALAVSPDQPDWVYFLVSNSNSAFLGLYRSVDSGATFSTRATSPNLLDWGCIPTGTSGQGWYDLALACNPQNANIVHVGGVNAFFSIDGGQSFTISGHWVGGPGNCNSSYLHADQHVFEYNPHNKLLFVGNDGGVFYKKAESENWVVLSDGMAISQIYKIGSTNAEERLIMNGYQDNGSALLNDTTWAVAMGGDGMECAIDYRDPNFMYGSIYYGSISRSTDYGYSFQPIANNGRNGINESGDWVTPYGLHSLDPNKMFIGYKNLWRSDNVKNGDPTTIRFSKISNLTTTQNIRVVEHSAADQNLLFFSNSSQLYKSNNVSTAATSVIFSQITSPTGINRITDILCDVRNAQVVYALRDNKVWKSSNQGTSWVDYSGTLPNIPMNSIIQDTTCFECLYLGTDAGVFYRDTVLNDWVIFSDGLALNSEVTELEIYYNRDRVKSRLRAATYGRGLWESPLYTRSGLMPVARFEVDDTLGCDGYAFQFTDLSNNGPTGWNWTFSPSTVQFTAGTTAQSQHPSVVFLQPGRYSVSLVANNAAGTDTFNQIGLINVGGGQMNIPFSIDFDSNNGGYQNEKRDQFDWTRNRLQTPSVGTGPLGDHTTGAGYYYYVEASAPNYPKKSTSFRSFCFDVSGMARPTLSFWYSNFGTDVGDLVLQVNPQGKGWETVWKISRNTGQAWKNAKVSLQGYTGKCKFRFIGTTSFFWSGDMAVDDIMVFDRPSTTDVRLAEIRRPGKFLCGPNTLGDSLEVLLINEGTEKVGNIPVRYQWGSNSPQAGTYSDSLMAGDSAYFVFAVPVQFPVGSHRLMAYSELNSDQFASNDTMKIDVEQGLTPTDPAVSGPLFVCKNDSTTLTAITTADSIYWYSSLSSGTPVGSGSTFSIFNLSKDSILYVQGFNSGRAWVGPEDTSISLGGFIPAINDSGVNFTVNARPGLILETVDIYTDSASTFWVKLIRGGVTLDSTQFFVNSGGKRTLQLNWYIPRNSGYTLAMRRISGGQVYRNYAGASYNYDVPNGISITGSTGGNQFYYYFYRWRIRYNACSSQRMRVTVKMVPRPVIQVTPQTFQVTRGDSVVLNASGARSYRWTPNTYLNVDTGSTVVSKPLQTIQYTVQGWDTLLCPTLQTSQIAVNGLASHDLIFPGVSLQVYPNPVQEILYLMPKTTVSGKGHLRLYDVKGKVVFQQQIQWEPYQQCEIKLPVLSGGFYQLEVQHQQQPAVTKLLILQD